jgi:hypothetical protein
MRNEYPIQAILRNGESAQFDEYQEVYNDLTGLDAERHVNTVYFNDLIFHGGKTNGDIISIFKNNEYSFLPVKGKEVIDVGANIGDSSIFFATKGAKKVIALEPNKKTYDYAVRNVTVNGHSAKIKVIFAACGSDATNNSIQGLEYLTMNRLITKYCSTPEVLKVDCEGCEYDFVLNASDQDLRRFSHIQIEYHYGYQNLKTKLESCGFAVRYTRPSLSILPHKNKLTESLTWSLEKFKKRKTGRMFIGQLYATAQPR